MSLQNHVTSLELSKRLKELLGERESIFSWSNLFIDDEKWVFNNALEVKDGFYLVKSSTEKEMAIRNIYDMDEDKKSLFPAYLASELGEILPRLYGSWRTLHGKKQEKYCCFDDQKIHTIFLADTEANARAKMVIYLLENKLITLGE